MLPVSCSERDDEPRPTSPNSLFELRDRQLSPPDIDTSTYSSDCSSSRGEVALGQFAENWEVPKERDYGRVGWDASDSSFSGRLQHPRSHPHGPGNIDGLRVITVVN